MLAAATRLTVVARAGVGLDNVDVAAATARGVMVVNAPRSNIVSAAEHAVALLLSAARHIPAADASLRQGQWKRSAYTGVELSGKTVGIVGLGKIGQLVAQRLAAFGVQLIAYDPYVAPALAAQLGIELLPLEELLRRADAISIHLPKTAETLGLIGKDQLALTKPGVLVVNAARGGLVDEDALAEARAQRPRRGRRHRRLRSPSRPPRARCSSCPTSSSPRTWARRPTRRRTGPAPTSPARCSSRSPASSCPTR